MTSVTIRRRPVQVSDPLDCLIALREVVGQSSAFLFESLAGPSIDTRNSLIGITGLLEISVYRGRVTLNGLPEVRQRTHAALLDAGVVRVLGEELVLSDDDALWRLPRAVDAVFDFERDPDEFGFGLLVYYGYDAVRYIEQLPRTIPDGDDPVPDAIFSLVHGLVKVDLETSSAVVTIAESQLWSGPDIDRLVQRIEAATGSEHAEDIDPVPVPLPIAVTDDVDEAEFVRRANTCLDHIRVGDIYQVQLGHEITVNTDADHMDVYRRLRWRNPSPYMCLLPIADRVVVGASPELFVRAGGGTVTMRPIAGTARRHESEEENARAVQGLLADPKERAEHIMLVDLCRNDLGRIAEPMSVDVPDLMVIETYSHMFHLVSNVSARAQAQYDVYDVIRASFPAGTMTGAPKVRAMEIIEGLEASRRGLYAGSFGIIGFGGWSILGLAIRMAVHSEGSYSLRASAGVVADSVPSNEWRETLTKLGATYWAVTGGELE
jgi:anthranilate synthase component 1